jgi:hypothetical protein
VTIPVEKLYTVQEAAVAMRRSVDTIRRLFRHEPGVQITASPKSRSKRPYSTMMIPHSVFMRVWNRITIKAA